MPNLYKELHARPPIAIEAPKLISIIAFIIESGQKSLSKEINTLIESILTYCNSPIPIYDKNKQQLYDCFNTQNLIKRKTDDGKIESLVVLQNHTSFFCITFIKDDDGIMPFKWSAIPSDVDVKKKYSAIIDEAVFKTHMRVEKFDPNQRAQDYNLQKTFNAETSKYQISDVFTDLLGSLVSDSKAIVWTPFNSFDDGFNRILVRDISLKPGRLGRLVRRLLEIDLYSTIAMRNFNSARIQLAELRKNEVILRDIVSTFNNLPNLHNLFDYQNCYKKISEMAIDIANIIATSRYSFQAVVAYSELVKQRVNEFREERVEGWTRISYFLERRFYPGVRTCEAALRSQIAVSQEIQGIANLLEAGLSLKLQQQEGERTRRSQEILTQQKDIFSKVSEIIGIQNKREIEESKFKKMIEYISIVPITYYLCSIFEHMFTEINWFYYAPTIAIFTFVTFKTIERLGTTKQ